MLSPQQLDRLNVVLVRARNPGNIGATARAMHDFGFRHLRVVNEYSVPFATARSAMDASQVVKGAKEFGSVAEAVADCNLVIGTTAVGERALQQPLYALPEAAGKIRDVLAVEGRVALLFGSEKTGLSNDELSHCHWLLTIPMHQHEAMRHPSMNLGQAVAVCLYELVRGDETSVAASVLTAEAGEMDRLRLLLTEMLQAIGYTERHPANCDEAQIRRLVLRMGMTAKDVPVWMGVLRQILWKTRKG
ncbi:MAG TPA: TrmJ/YjtD family RNA methyltransferase [Edaphobacter sp.]|nr:TrmJ/YjtD family RNA methyltransferase [Edaphobacter sp.]